MSEKPGISYSFQVGAAQAPGRQAAGPQAEGQALLAIDDYKTLGVSGGVLMVGLTTGGQMLAQPQVEVALQHCTVFRTLEDHARHLVAVLPQLGGNIADVVRVLEQVQQSGLFLNADSICERVNQRLAAAEAPDRSKAFIITCDRPQAVARLLETMLHSAKLARQKHLYLVDDSRDPANAAGNREAVERFNMASPTAMTYFGAAEQQQLIDDLEAALPEHGSAIRFLLERSRWEPLKTYGRSRTLCLLLSVGDRCVVMDDDVLCLAVSAGEPDAAIGFSDGQGEAAFFTSGEEWQELWRPTGFDPLTGHARCLGLNLADALAELGVARLEPAQLAGVSASLFRSLNAQTPVLVTQAGTVGDPGTNDNAWLPNLRPPSIRNMLSAPGGLQTALSSRDCWLGHRRPTLSKRAVMSQVTGLDNRHPLPPYFPALRGEDHLFGSLLDFLIPDSTVLEYDWAVPHLPLEARQGNPEGDSVAPSGGLQLVSAYLTEVKPDDPGVSYETRLQLAAARLQQLSELSTGSLLARFRAGLTRAQAFALQTLNDRLADTGALDDSWKAYLETNAQRCIAALQQPASLAGLKDAPPGADDEVVATSIRTAAAGYAQALLAWPAIRAAAAARLNTPR